MSKRVYDNNSAFGECVCGHGEYGPQSLKHFSRPLSCSAKQDDAWRVCVKLRQQTREVEIAREENSLLARCARDDHKVDQPRTTDFSEVQRVVPIQPKLRSHRRAYAHIKQKPQ